MISTTSRRPKSLLAAVVGACIAIGAQLPSASSRANDLQASLLSRANDLRVDNDPFPDIILSSIGTTDRVPEAGALVDVMARMLRQGRDRSIDKDQILPADQVVRELIGSPSFPLGHVFAIYPIPRHHGGARQASDNTFEYGPQAFSLAQLEGRTGLAGRPWSTIRRGTVVAKALRRVMFGGREILPAKGKRANLEKLQAWHFSLRGGSRDRGRSEPKAGAGELGVTWHHATTVVRGPAGRLPDFGDGVWGDVDPIDAPPGWYVGLHSVVIARNGAAPRVSSRPRLLDLGKHLPGRAERIVALQVVDPAVPRGQRQVVISRLSVGRPVAIPDHFIYRHNAISVQVPMRRKRDN